MICLRPVTKHFLSIITIDSGKHELEFSKWYYVGKLTLQSLNDSLQTRAKPKRFLAKSCYKMHRMNHNLLRNVLKRREATLWRSPRKKI